MVELVFLGVGEAFDERLPNTSVLLRYEAKSAPLALLMDCGFTVPPRFWREVPDPEALTGIWISHFHGDHTFGLPALLVRFLEEGRKRPLTILGQKGVESSVLACLDVAYPGFHKLIDFPIHFVEVEPEQKIDLLGLVFETAESDHSQRDLAVRVELEGGSIFYSGDGEPTQETAALARGTSLIIHEAFRMDAAVRGHGTVKGSIEMARACGAAHLALVHIQRGERDEVIARMKDPVYSTGRPKIFVPEPGERFVLEDGGRGSDGRGQMADDR
jgi:ribonuclease BN (tRNA processing enzyme)